MEEMLPRPPTAPPMKKRDMTLEQLRSFDGETGTSNDEIIRMTKFLGNLLSEIEMVKICPREVEM